MSKLLQNLEFLAQEFRNINSLSEHGPIRIKSLLQKNKILTVYRPLSKGLSGMSIKIDNNSSPKYFLLVNSNHSIGKQHFTICHEFYHLFYQKNFTSSISLTGKFDKNGNPEEYNADMFASYLLLPHWGVWGQIPEPERIKNKITISTLLSIEHFYSCSRSALLNRLLAMNLISEEFKELHSKDIKINAARLGYSSVLYEKGNENIVIGNYGSLAYKAWDDGIISESYYLSLLKDIGVDLSIIFENSTDE